MNIKLIRSLAEIVKQSNLASLEVTEGDLHIKIEGQAPTPITQVVQMEQSQPLAMPQVPQNNFIANASAPPAQIDETIDAGLDFNDIFEVKSNMVGVFYQASAPGAEPYVKVGQKIKKGDILCILEAMKLMNEIAAEKEGQIVDICVSDGDVVEFGQTLFKMI